MVPIKFSGRDILTGVTVYGIYGEEHGRAIIADEHSVFTVEPESVKRLAGYDADGNEMYDEDIRYVAPRDVKVFRKEWQRCSK